MKLRTHWWDNFRFHIDDDVDFGTFGEFEDNTDNPDEVSNNNKLHNQLSTIIEEENLENNPYFPYNKDYTIKEKWETIKYVHDNYSDLAEDIQELVKVSRLKIFFDYWNDYLAAFYIIKTILEKKNWQKEWQKDYDKDNSDELLHTLSDEKPIGELLQDAYDKLKCIRDDENPLYGIYRPDNESDLREIIEFVDSDFNLNWIDVRGFNLSGLFRNLSFFNGDIFLWDVSNATDMSEMFSGCTEFNGDLSQWIISKGANTENMFRNCNINEDHKPTKL